MLAAEQHVVTPALERVVEANTYLSGVGFESGGLAAAHAIHNGMTAIPDAHHYYHGEKWRSNPDAAGAGKCAGGRNRDRRRAVPQRWAADHPAQLDIKGDIPTKMRLVAEAACAEGETIHNMPGGVDSDRSTPHCWWPTSMVSASCRNGNKPEQNTRRQPGVLCISAGRSRLCPSSLDTDHRQRQYYQRNATTFHLSRIFM